MYLLFIQFIYLIILNPSDYSRFGLFVNAWFILSILIFLIIIALSRLKVFLCHLTQNNPLITAISSDFFWFTCSSISERYIKSYFTVSYKCALLKNSYTYRFDFYLLFYCVFYSRFDFGWKFIYLLLLPFCHSSKFYLAFSYKVQCIRFFTLPYYFLGYSKVERFSIVDNKLQLVWLKVLK